MICRLDYVVNMVANSQTREGRFLCVVVWVVDEKREREFLKKQTDSIEKCLIPVVQAYYADYNNSLTSLTAICDDFRKNQKEVEELARRVHDVQTRLSSNGSGIQQLYYEKVCLLSLILMCSCWPNILWGPSKTLNTFVRLQKSSILSLKTPCRNSNKFSHRLVLFVLVTCSTKSLRCWAIPPSPPFQRSCLSKTFGIWRRRIWRIRWWIVYWRRICIDGRGGYCVGWSIMEIRWSGPLTPMSIIIIM